jgi:hypothetical protein
MFSNIAGIQGLVAEAAGVPYNEKLYNSAEEDVNLPIHHPFKLPIAYLPETEIHPLSEIVKTDLELVKSSKEQNKSMYEQLFRPSHPLGSNMIDEWKKHYTVNADYIQETQDVIVHADKLIPKEDAGYKFNYESIEEIWKDVKQDAYFLEKYCFVEWDLLKPLNQSSTFLQVLSVGNLMSPVMSFIVPFLFLLFPFIILKFRGIPISFSVYLDVLRDIARNHFIGKTLMSMTSISLDKIIYLMLTVGLYFWQMYQNVILCQRFYVNIYKINNSLYEMRQYTDYSIKNMEMFIFLHGKKSTYLGFCSDLERNILGLRRLREELEMVDPGSSGLFSKIGQIGYLLKCYYEVHANMEYESCLRFSFGFEGYLDNLAGVNHHLSSGAISPVIIDRSAKSFLVQDQYYPPYCDSVHVKNDCSLKNNMIITGPNASGKTTLLKTTTLNIIFSQQIGYGFYKSCVLNPYDYIHSYLNIPDTSERDSLFQAESRRCKDIIDSIRDNPLARHYCIFDELYSGTNPKEAANSAKAFLKYLSKHENVDFILTTHYVSICKKLEKLKCAKNYKMDVVEKEDGEFEYTYKMKKGVSKIKGAFLILKQMDYPAEILADMAK